MNQASVLTPPPAASAETVGVGSETVRGNAKIAFAFLWLFTFWVFGRPEDVFPILDPLRVPLVFGICATTAFVGSLVFGQARLHWSRELALVLCLTAWFALGLPFSIWRSGSLGVFTDLWIKTLLGFLLVSQVVTSIDRVRKILWAIVLSQLLATSASFLIQGKEVGNRLIGINLDMFGWNYLGITASVTLPYIAVLYMSRRSALRTTALVATLASTMWILVLNASRGGFFNILFSMLLTSIFILRRSARGRAIGLVVAMCLCLAIAAAPSVLWTRLATVWGGSSTTTNDISASAQESTDSRQVLLRNSIAYTIENPIFGLGLGNFAVYNGKMLHRPDAWLGTHNTYTQLSSEAGIPALIIFLLLIATIVRQARRTAKAPTGSVDTETHLLASATIVGVASFAFGGFFAHIAYVYLFYYLAGISAGLRVATASQLVKPNMSPSSGLPASRRSAKW